MEQNEAVLRFMQDHGTISTLQANRELGITRLSARIYDLRKLGFKIDSRRKTVNTQHYGKTSVCEYFLED